MHYLLFFPGESSNAGRCLRGVGMADFSDGVNEKPERIDGVSGLLCGWGGAVALDPANQRWVQMSGFRLGIWTNAEFAPRDIARRSIFDGRNVTFSSGLQWSVPTAADLPSLIVKADSHWKRIRKPQFADFWNQSEIWFKRFMDQRLDEEQMRIASELSEQEFLDEWAEFCVFALRQNYRVTPEIISELAPFDTDDMFRITLAAIDGMTINEVADEASEIAERAASGLPKKSEN
jgi:hypothetical protein